MKQYLEKMDTTEKKFFFSVIAIGFLSLLIPAFKQFNHDEFEHIHCIWYIANGFLPFQDFFQNHNPLYWYLLKPFYAITKDSVYFVILVRYLNYFFLTGGILITHLISFHVTKSRMTAWITTLLLFSFQLFFRTGIEIRPDVPQVFFGLLAVYCFFLFLKSNKNRDLIFCGVSISISFLFLQKAVFLVMALGIIVLFLLIKKRIHIMPFFIFCFSALFPLFIFFLFLYQSDLITDYYITNILVNANRIITFSPFHTLHSYLEKDFLFYLLILIATWRFLKYRNLDKELRYLLFMGWFLFGSLFFVNRPHAQNFMQLIPLLSIICGVFLNSIIKEKNLRKRTITLMIIIILLPPISQIARLAKKNNLKELNIINFVLKNTDTTDYVYDGDIKFNLFRQDLHYFWYSVDKGKLLDSYNRVTNNRYGDYNIYSLIKAKKPKIISDFELDVTHKSIAEFYEKTDYKHIYIRN